MLTILFCVAMSFVGGLLGATVGAVREALRR